MINPVKKLFVTASAAALLTGCAASSDIDDLNYQLRVVNKKLEDMKATTVGDLQKRQAAASSQMDQLENEIIELKSQLEESYYLNQRLREQNKELEQSISSVARQEASKREEALARLQEQQRNKDEQINKLNQKLLEQQESVKKIQLARIQEAERKAKEAAIDAELAQKRSSSLTAAGGASAGVKSLRATKTKVKKSVVAPPVEKKATSKPAAMAASPSTEAKKQADSPAPQTSSAKGTDSFAAAESLYSRGKYSEAFSAFAAVAADSSSPDAVNAKFMMGESQYQQKEYDKAIMQFQKIISQHPSDPNVPAALLKQAMAFEKLADKETAKVLYKKLIKKHGGSKEAATAKKRLEEL